MVSLGFYVELNRRNLLSFIETLTHCCYHNFTFDKSTALLWGVVPYDPAEVLEECIVFIFRIKGYARHASAKSLLLTYSLIMKVDAVCTFRMT
jgi:hypothetical protein